MLSVQRKGTFPLTRDLGNGLTEATKIELKNCSWIPEKILEVGKVVRR